MGLSHSDLKPSLPFLCIKASGYFRRTEWQQQILVKSEWAVAQHWLRSALRNSQLLQPLGRCFHPSRPGTQRKVWDTVDTRSLGFCFRASRSRLVPAAECRAQLGTFNGLSSECCAISLPPELQPHRVLTVTPQRRQGELGQQQQLRLLSARGYRETEGLRGRSTANF